jgi:hypothetical protein
MVLVGVSIPCREGEKVAILHAPGRPKPFRDSKLCAEIYLSIRTEAEETTPATPKKSPRIQ